MTNVNKCNYCGELRTLTTGGFHMKQGLDTQISLRDLDDGSPTPICTPCMRGVLMEFANGLADADDPFHVVEVAEFDTEEDACAWLENNHATDNH